MIDPRKASLYRFLYLGFVLGIGTLSACFLSRTPASDTKVRPQEWRESRGPVIPHDKFPSDCTLCHAKGSWHEIRKDFVFDHAKETGTPLNGAHAQAQCLRCHNDRGEVALFAKRGCSGCHEDLHRGRLGIQCTSCHSENSWNPTGIYAMHSRTRFPLTGIHVGVACFRCHPAAESGQFLGADPRCEACHRNDAVQAKSMNHVAQGLMTNCQQCHGGVTWSGAHFNHAGIISGCDRCHAKDFSITANPVHAALGVAKNCEQCHSPSGHWRDGVYHRTWLMVKDHNVACNLCHTTPGSFRTFDCLRCHPKTDMDDKHRGRAGYAYVSTVCYGCHPTGQQR